MLHITAWIKYSFKIRFHFVILFFFNVTARKCEVCVWLSLHISWTSSSDHFFFKEPEVCSGRKTMSVFLQLRSRSALFLPFLFFWGRNCQIMKTSETCYKFYVFRQESKAANRTIKSINVLNVFAQPKNLLISAFFFFNNYQSIQPNSVLKDHFRPWNNFLSTYLPTRLNRKLREPIWN